MIQNKILLKIKTVVNYLNFFFYTELKTKSKNKSLNLSKKQWHFGYTNLTDPLLHFSTLK